MKVASLRLTCEIRYVEKRIDFIEFYKVLTTAKDTREVIDINVLNAEIKTTVAKIDKLRAEIIAEIEV